MNAINSILTHSLPFLYRYEAVSDVTRFGFWLFYKKKLRISCV